MPSIKRCASSPGLEGPLQLTVCSQRHNTHTHKMSQETNVPKSVWQYSGQILINKSNCTAAKENFLSHSQEPPGVKPHLAKPTPSVTNKQGAFFRLCRDAIWEHKLSEYTLKQQFSERDPASPGPCWKSSWPLKDTGLNHAGPLAHRFVSIKSALCIPSIFTFPTVNGKYCFPSAVAWVPRSTGQL